MSQQTKRILEKIVVPSILLAALIAVSFYGITKQSEADSYKQTAQISFRRAFSQLCDDFAEMETHLSKLKAAASPARCIILLDDVWRLSGSSVSLMSQIPSSHIDTNELNSFVVRVGDYAHALTKRLLNGESLSNDDAKQIASLQEKCKEISEELNSRLASGDIPLLAIDNEGFFTENEYENSEGLDKFPTLIYDGPFSESTEKAEAKGLKGEKVSEAEAEKIALDILKLQAEPIDSVYSDGKIPSYDFTFKTDSGYTDISITTQGGMLLWFMKNGAEIDADEKNEALNAEPLITIEASEENDVEKLSAAAQKWLSQHGFENMHPTYAQYYSGMAVINFAATQDDVILYNDLVKVWISTKTLDIIGADARNYIFSHTKRELNKPAISIEEAKERLSKSLEIEDTHIALIPITPSTEVLCYEFKTTAGKEEFIVYINANNGNEEEIFKIINTENGQLVI